MRHRPLARRRAPWALLVLFALGCGSPPPAVETTTVRTNPTSGTAGAPVAAPTSTVAADQPAAPGTASARDADAPRALAFDPPLDAKDVDPTRTTISVSFDRPMDRDGWAWVIESAETAPAIGESSWDFAAEVNTAQVTLQPSRTYVVWLNSSAYPYFRDLKGHSLAPVRWTFTTAAAPGGVQTISAHGGAAATRHGR